MLLTSNLMLPNSEFHLPGKRQANDLSDEIFSEHLKTKAC